MNPTWRKHIAVWRNRLYLYPAPDAMPHTPLFWLATGLVTLATLLFAGYFIFYLTGRHDAYITSAEDLGIMDQAIWSTLHGHLFHQTICNTVSDINCYGFNGISRFAIHFLISLSYVIWPNPKTLLVIQSLVVASGAFPAFWLARLRLRNELAAVVIALLYLLYPAQQQASIFEFHAVTLTAALLLFTLYFMYTRRTVWLFVFAILSMACKEELPVVIACFGLWSMLFQHRWRSGLGLVALATVWVVVELLMFRLFSPTGRPLLASRYAYLGSGPLQIVLHIVRHPLSMLHQHVLEHNHLQYLRTLLGPAGYLPLLAPWVLVLAVPSMALNLFSADLNQYLGIFQYSAEIVPVLIFATIEAIVVIIWLVQWFVRRIREQNEQAQVQVGEKPVAASWRLERWIRPASLVVLLGFVLFNVVSVDFTYGALPFSRGFGWPHVTAHDALAQRLIEMIPASASVSAQSTLVPHISERTNIYQFPYDDDNANYIFLDITSTTYPYQYNQYTTEVKRVLLNGRYGVVAAQDGYLLLKRGLPSPGISPYSPTQIGDEVIPDLPDSFCSFARVSPQAVTHALQVDFMPSNSSAADISLVGYSVAPPTAFSIVTPFMQVTAFWKVNTPNPPPLEILVLLIDKNGKEQFSSIDFPALAW